jgi:Fungal protein of unknown function (DUF1774)
MLWVRGRFWFAELLLIINFFNLTSLYFRHSTTPRFVHIPVVSAPYAWTYVAILWNGAAMVNAHSLPARIVANVAIWGILAFGAFFIFAFKDYTMGFELAILSLGKSEPAQDSNILLTKHSRSTWTAGQTIPCFAVDICVRHYGMSTDSVSVDWHPWYAWRKRKYPTRGTYRGRGSGATTIAERRIVSWNKAE